MSEIIVVKDKERKKMGVKVKNKITNMVVFSILTLGAIIMIIPLIWMISTSLKTKLQVFEMPPKWIPNPFVWSKYKDLLTAGSDGSGQGTLVQGFVNSIKVSFTVTIVGSFTSSLAAFGFAKLNFPHKEKIFLALIGTMMIPFPVVMIPQFILFSKIGWVDTLAPLIVPGLFGNVVMIFFLRQYLSTLPNEIIDAAKIDGASFFKIYYRIVFPLMLPAVSAQVILWFMGVWNDFLAPTIYINTASKMTIQPIINAFNATYAIQTDYPLIMAASVTAMIPIIIVFIVFQKWIIESVAISGVKG